MNSEQRVNSTQPRVAILGAAFRAERLRKGIGLRELARQLGMNAALLSNFEFGTRTPHPDDAAFIAGALGITGDARTRVMQLARSTTGAVAMTGGQIGDTVRDLEAVAGRTVSWEPWLVPEPLWTPDYAREVHIAYGYTATRDAALPGRTIDRDRDRVPSVSYVGLAVLADPAGSIKGTTLAAQLRKLAALNHSSEDTIIHIVPAAAVAARPTLAALASPWTFYEMPSTYTGIVCINHQHTALFVTDADGRYRRARETLRDASLDIEESTRALRLYARKHDPPD